MCLCCFHFKHICHFLSLSLTHTHTHVHTHVVCTCQVWRSHKQWTQHSCEPQQRYRGRADHRRHCCQYRHRLTAMHLTCLLVKPQQSMTTRERSRAVFAHFTAYTIPSLLYPGMCSYLFHCVCFTIFVYEPLAGKSVQCIYTVI